MRAPMISAPTMATSTSPYMASADRRVNIHIKVSKFAGRVL